MKLWKPSLRSELCLFAVFNQVAKFQRPQSLPFAYPDLRLGQLLPEAANLGEAWGSHGAWLTGGNSASFCFADRYLSFRLPGPFPQSQWIWFWDLVARCRGSFVVCSATCHFCRWASDHTVISLSGEEFTFYLSLDSTCVDHSQHTFHRWPLRLKMDREIHGSEGIQWIKPDYIHILPQL